MKILARDSVEFLLIDDDPAITKFLVTYLKQKGHTCEFLTEGFKTAAWLEFHRCDVAVVDLNMPKVDGLSLISFIREMSQTLPIIVFTGVGYDEERMHAALRAGANGYVSKNLPIEQLYCVLSRVLATCQQRARRERRNYLGVASSRSQRNASAEMHSAPHALAVSCSSTSLVATSSLNLLPYLLARRSTIESAVCPSRE